MRMLTFVLTLVVALGLWSMSVSAQSAYEAHPVAALVFVESNGDVTLHVDFGDALSIEEQWTAPDGVQLLALDDSPLPSVVTTMQLPTRYKDYLLLNGEPTPQPIPTITPYVRRASVPFMLGEHTRDQVNIIMPADANIFGHRFVAVTCDECQTDWAQQVLVQLPPGAPIVVIAPYVAEIDGAWRIKAQPATFDGVVTDDGAARATLFVRQKGIPIGVVKVTDVRQVADTPVEQFVYRDGRSRLLTVVLCLVGVLFLSVSSFYLSLAVMRRMHAAVGYNPNDGK